VAAAFGILTVWWRRRFDAKNEFATFISITKGRIPKEGIWKFHASTKTEIRDSVSRLIACLNPKEVNLIEGAWAAYSGIDERKLDDQNEDDLRREAMARDRLPVPPKPSDVLKAHLDKLYESIK